MPVDEEDFIPACSEQVAEFGDRGSADAIAGLLEGEAVHARVEAFGSVAGLPAGYRVLVDPRQLHRARWVLRDSDFSEQELSYLATGEFGDGSEE
jgi:hypothetical protein